MSEACGLGAVEARMSREQPSHAAVVGEGQEGEQEGKASKSHVRRCVEER